MNFSHGFLMIMVKNVDAVTYNYVNDRIKGIVCFNTNQITSISILAPYTRSIPKPTTKIALCNKIYQSLLLGLVKCVIMRKLLLSMTFKLLF